MHCTDIDVIWTISLYLFLHKSVLTSIFGVDILSVYNSKVIMLMGTISPSIPPFQFRHFMLFSLLASSHLEQLFHKTLTPEHCTFLGQRDSFVLGLLFSTLEASSSVYYRKEDGHTNP